MIYMSIGKRKLSFKIGRDLPAYLLILPAFITLIIFHYLPLYGVLIAFQEYNPYKGILGSPWVGLANFKYFLLDYNYWRVMRNTIIINFYNLIFEFPAPIIFALLLNEIINLKFKKVVQTVSYLPYFLSGVIIAGIVSSILSPSSGLVNLVLNKLFNIEPIYFLTRKEYFRGILVSTSIWSNFGMGAVYYLASLSSIDPQLYDAARIDGAGKWKQTYYITLPGIRSIAIILFVLRIGAILNIGFEMIFLLYNPLVYDVGDVISTYTYRLGIEQTRYSLTSAIGLTQSIVNFLLVQTGNKLSKKIAGWSLW